MVATSKSPDGGGAAGGLAPVASAAEVASRGINDTRDLTRLGGSLINDLLAGTVGGKVANPVCRAANTMLRATDLEHRHNDGKPLPMS